MYVHTSSRPWLQWVRVGAIETKCDEAGVCHFVGWQAYAYREERLPYMRLPIPHNRQS